LPGSCSVLFDAAALAAGLAAAPPPRPGAGGRSLALRLSAVRTSTLSTVCRA
jgi:hypothetical protein